MPHLLSNLFAERSMTKVASLHPNRASAERAAEAARQGAGLAPNQVVVLGPDDAKRRNAELFSRSLQPESRGIFRSIGRTHAVLGVLGLVAGLVVYVALRASGSPAVATSPWLALVLCVFITTACGLMLGGALALRPDQIRVIARVRSGLRAGRWAVAVHALSADQAAQAGHALQRAGGEVLRSA